MGHNDADEGGLEQLVSVEGKVPHKPGQGCSYLPVPVQLDPHPELDETEAAVDACGLECALFANPNSRLLHATCTECSLGCSSVKASIL